MMMRGQTLLAITIIGSALLTGCQSPQQAAERDLERHIKERQRNQAASQKLYQKGLDAYRENLLEEASTDLKGAVQLDGRNAAALTALGVVAFHQDEISMSLESFRRAARLTPSRYEPHYNLGIVLESVNYYREAINAYRAALALAPHSLEVKENLARALIKSGQDLAQAKIIIDEAMNEETRPRWQKWLQLQSIKLNHIRDMETSDNPTVVEGDTSTENQQ